MPGAVLTGSPTSRLPNSASFCFPGTSGEAVLLELERRGVVSSSGSACAAGSDEPSHVLTALGVPGEVAQTAVRLTFPADLTREQADAAVGRADGIRFCRFSPRLSTPASLAKRGPSLRSGLGRTVASWRSIHPSGGRSGPG